MDLLQKDVLLLLLNNFNFVTQALLEQMLGSGGRFTFVCYDFKRLLHAQIKV